MFAITSIKGYPSLQARSYSRFSLLGGHSGARHRPQMVAGCPLGPHFRRYEHARRHPRAGEARCRLFVVAVDGCNFLLSRFQSFHVVRCIFDIRCLTSRQKTYGAFKPNQSRCNVTVQVAGFDTFTDTARDLCSPGVSRVVLRYKKCRSYILYIICVYTCLSEGK